MSVSWLDQINWKYHKSGGKAVGLAKLMKISSINVPKGFVLNYDFKFEEIENNSKIIFDYFEALNVDFVAVRSSANIEDSQNFSFAGQFDSKIGIKRAELLRAIEFVYKSYKSDKIKYYLQGQNINIKDIKMSVIIQEMINSEISGIAFSSNPINKNENEIIVEAIYGLGEPAVSGIITPDKYIFDKVTGILKSKTINIQESSLILDINCVKSVEIPNIKQNDTKLNQKYWGKLLSNINTIEQSFGYPVDVEWAILNDKIYILQARPISTL